MEMTMNSRLFLYLFLTGLLLVSLSLIAGIYRFLPIEDTITRQLLFGIAFQMWGIIVTVLIVKKVLDMRDAQRWESINKYVFGFLYLLTWGLVGEVFSIFGVKIDVKESSFIEKFGVQYMNPEHYREWKEKARQELEKVVKEGADTIRTNIKTWQPSKHKKFSSVLSVFQTKINDLFSAYPHQIPPEFLSPIVEARDRARGLSNLSGMLSDVEFIRSQGRTYAEVNASFVDMESRDVLDLFSKTLKVLDVLEKNVGKEWK